MKKRFFAWKDANCDGKNPKWIEMSGKEFYAFKQLPGNYDRKFVALSDAIEKLLADGTLKENPIIEPVGAISAGIVDGEVRLDLNYEEDSHAQVDSNVVLTKSGKIIEFQTTAEGEPYEFNQMMEIFRLAQKGIYEVIEKY